MTRYDAIAALQGEDFDLHRVRDLVERFRPELRYWVRNDELGADRARFDLCAFATGFKAFAFDGRAFDRYLESLETSRYIWEHRGDVAREVHPDSLSDAYEMMMRIEDQYAPQGDYDFYGLTADEVDTEDVLYSTMDECKKYVETALGEFVRDYDIDAIARECFSWSTVGGFRMSVSYGRFWDCVFAHDVTAEVTVDA